ECKSYVSPSDFFLDRQGRMVNHRTENGSLRIPEEMAEGRYSGLEKGEFTPLPQARRTTDPNLAQQFASRYEAYKSTVVVPWVSAIASCHALVVLVDVLNMLESGHGMFNDNHQILE